MKQKTQNPFDTEVCLKCGKRENKLGWNTMSCNCKYPETIESLREDINYYRFFSLFYYFAFIIGVLFIGVIVIWKLGGFN